MDEGALRAGGASEGERELAGGSLEVVGMGDPSACGFCGTLGAGCPGGWQVWGPQEPCEGPCGAPLRCRCWGTPLIAPGPSGLRDEEGLGLGVVACGSFGAAGEDPGLHVGAPSHK